MALPHGWLLPCFMIARRQPIDEHLRSSAEQILTLLSILCRCPS
jgi:hypothetical protein